MGMPLRLGAFQAASPLGKNRCVCVARRSPNLSLRIVEASRRGRQLARKSREAQGNLGEIPGTLNKNDLIKLGTEIAKNVSDDSDKDEEGSPLLAIPFTAPAGDAAAQSLAESAFATAYGKISLSRHGQVSVTTEPLPSRDLGAALERGRANHSTYVLSGTADTVGKAQVLTVKIAKVADGSVVWSKTYPAPADPTKIAAEVEAKIPPLAGKSP
jgi:TolB-like protein